MQFGIRTNLLAGAAFVVAGLLAPAREAAAQMDLTPPGVANRPAARPAAPRRAAPRPQAEQGGAPRTAPLPEPPPDDRPAAVATDPEPTAPAPAVAAPAAPQTPSPETPAPPRLATVPPTTPAATELPLGPASRIDEAFRAAGAAQPSDGSKPAGTPPAAPTVAQPATPPAEPPFAEAPTRRVEGRTYPEQQFPVGRSAHYPTIRKEAEAVRVPIDLADAVATIESAYNPQAVGGSDEIGIMQLRPSIAKQLGYEGTVQELFVPETNIRLGVAYLAGAWERSGGNVCEALMKYRTGWDETRMSALSFEYCRRAVVHLTAIGSPLARGIVLPTRSGPPVVGTPAEGPSTGRNTGRFNWADHDSRLRRIDQQFGGQNFGIIARERQAP